MNDLVDLVLKDSFTHSQALKRLGLLKDFLNGKVFGKEESDLSAYSPSDRRWLDTLDKNNLAQFNQENIHTLFEQAEKVIKEITPLSVILPFELPERETIELGARLRRDYGPHFLFEVKLDPKLIAGPAFIWKGVYKDHSVKTKIEAQKQQILQIFKQMTAR